MRYRPILLFLLISTGGALAPANLLAQATPTGDELAMCEPEDADSYEYLFYACAPTNASMLPNGLLALGFRRSYRRVIEEENLEQEISETWVELLDSSGNSVGQCGGGSSTWEVDHDPNDAVATGTSDENVIAAWDTYEDSTGLTSIQVRWCSSPGHPVLDATIDASGDAWAPVIAANANGQVVVAWERCEDCGDLRPTSLGAQAFGSGKRPVTPVLYLEPQASAVIGWPSLGIDAVGRFMVVWSEGRGLRGQRFGRDGRLLGGRIEILEDNATAVRDYVVLADGNLVVAWSMGIALPALQLRRYTADGLPATPLSIALGRASAMSEVFLTADRRGNLAVLWNEARGPRVLLLNRDLVPQGAFDLGPSGTFAGVIALSDSGLLFSARIGSGDPVIGRFWQARHEADACVRRGNLFLCDTANDGAAAEARLALGEGHPAEIPFLADWDGDGRADPCLYRGGRFFCDTGHDNGTDVRSPTVGTTGDKPLLGDLNGDGKADPCVRRGAAILCDLARDGGSKDLRIVFGMASDKVLLGDPNGDGRDDPCLLRSGRLLCDTAHDGNLAELTLDLRPLNAQGPTLFGDVNGDGRDEACRFTGSRFMCGVYSIKGGKPMDTIEIVFGRPGDIPLLGDLDAF